ncbi:MAG: hypothetical protein K2J82_07120 [Muribaculaceae bacterium]|nr:hypothetical protein [Muribaculaceae bacterium]
MNNSLRNKIDDLKHLTDALETIPSTVGISPKFIIPGFIGCIQEMITEARMSKYINRPIYNNKNYFDCANYIMDIVDEICKIRETLPDFKGKTSEDPINFEILEVSYNAIGAWENIYPEIANWVNQKVDNKTTSILYVLEKNVSDSLSEIMVVPEIPSKIPMKNLAKLIGYQYLGYILNCILILLIVGLITFIIKK